MIRYVWGIVYGRRRARELFLKENVQFLSFFTCFLVNRWGNLPQALNWLSGIPLKRSEEGAALHTLLRTHTQPRIQQFLERPTGGCGLPVFRERQGRVSRLGIHSPCWEERDQKHSGSRTPGAVCGRTDEKKIDCRDRRDHPLRRCAVSCQNSSLNPVE